MPITSDQELWACALASARPILAFILTVGMGYPAVRWLLAMVASL